MEFDLLERIGTVDSAGVEAPVFLRYLSVRGEIKSAPEIVSERSNALRTRSSVFGGDELKFGESSPDRICKPSLDLFRVRIGIPTLSDSLLGEIEMASRGDAQPLVPRLLVDNTHYYTHSRICIVFHCRVMSLYRQS